MKKHVLVFGGLGNPQSSVVKLYAPLFAQLENEFKIIAIDPLKDKLDVCERSSELGIHYSDFFCSLERYSRKYLEKSCVAASFILTPVITHLSIIKALLNQQKIDSSLVIVEKPSFALNQTKQGFDEVISGLKSQGVSFYFIDTAIVSPSMEYLFTQNCLPKGLPHKIVALAADNPCETIPSLDAFKIEHRVPFLNERKLLNIDSSGGAGFGLDMGIHAAAGMMRFLQRAKIDYQTMNIDQVILEAIDNEDLNRMPGAETHLYSKGDLHCSDANIAFVFEGGKGADTWDRRLELYYLDCTIVIGFGTLKHYPYIRFISSRKSWSRCFSVDGSGYQQHFKDLIGILQPVGDEQLLVTCEQSESLMRDAMIFLDDIYQHVPAEASEREAVIQRVSVHRPKFLTQSEFFFRKEMQRFLNNEALIQEGKV